MSHVALCRKYVYGILISHMHTLGTRARLHACLCACLVSCVLPTVCWMKVTTFHCSNCFKIPPFLFKSDFRSVHHPSWCSRIIYSHSREDNHENVYFLCQQSIKMCENVYERILLDSSLILFSSPYWLSLVINSFQLSPCFRDGNVSSMPRLPQRLFDKDSVVSETKAGETNGCQRSQFMLLSCLGESSTPDDYATGATTAVLYRCCINQNRLEGILGWLGYFLDNEQLLFFMTADSLLYLFLLDE